MKNYNEVTLFYPKVEDSKESIKKNVEIKKQIDKFNKITRRKK